jgi:hypothetical protein
MFYARDGSAVSAAILSDVGIQPIKWMAVFAVSSKSCSFLILLDNELG